MKDARQKLLRVFKEVKAGLSDGGRVEEQSELGEGGWDPTLQSSMAVPLMLDVRGLPMGNHRQTQKCHDPSKQPQTL